MKHKKHLLIALMTVLATGASAQTAAARFDMSVKNGKITEQVSGTEYAVASELPVCTLSGIDGQALRFDGYSNFVQASLPGNLSTEALTLSVTLAAESYPMMQVDVAESTPTFATICGNLDETGKKGFSLELSSQGDLRFRFASAYANGFLYTISGTEKLPRGTWNVLTVVLNKADNVATLYLNGKSIGTSRMSRSEVVHTDKDFYIGKDATEKKEGPFLINTFCGLIDDITLYNEVVTPAVFTPQFATFNYPAERYEASLWRPQFHGMPSGSWTNESHGMTYSDGKYHVFFQKNANGPYMSRLHWGHISSPNLYNWTEEPIAIGPDQTYDIKGCWSGCVYEDGTDTYLLYTAVDNAKATIAQAKAKDSELMEWEKLGVIINGRPIGLSDDFRDPYFFTANGQKYIIVGTSKNKLGACTLHKYENGKWTNDGAIFFQGTNANLHGTFWEMPNVTPMGNGKYLFTCTPLNTGVGVRTLCWVGTIGTDGKFTPDSEMQYLEMAGISRDGYGLLSPTIFTKDGKPLLLGIVPDKLPTQTNFEMGWAHNFSLPREISLTADGSIVQKPYSGLTGMRTKTAYSKELALDGIESLAPVEGRQIELSGEFTVASGSCGFNFLKSGGKQASLSYDADNGTLTLDMTSLDRTVNDGTYGGIYAVTLPKKVALGGKLKLHVYLDGSIADIFVNDTWAYSIRIFPNDAAQVEVEAFATAQMQADLKAWTLDATQNGDTGIDDIRTSQPADGYLYDILGRRQSSAHKGICIQNGKKYVGR
ncbi:MAG: GH32 C-terminal domain-containing protein [Bacteroidales bacterium]|nr:GH32 C-terminal domain-containing protein [Bacteroidales bacterium]